MSEVLNNMKNRRSIRKYKEDMVPRDMIDQVVEAGLCAPSARNLQSSVILVVTNKELRDRLSALNAQVMGSTANPFFGAPVVLVVLGRKECPNRVYDGGLVMGNMLLAAHALGLGSCWIHRAKEVFDSPEGKAILKEAGLEGEFEGIGNCILGYADGEYPKAPERKENRVYFAE